MERDKYFSNFLYSICEELNSFFSSETQKKICPMVRKKPFEWARIFNAGIINILLEHRTFFKLPLFEEVPRNFVVNCLPKQFLDSIKRSILLLKGTFSLVKQEMQ